MAGKLTARQERFIHEYLVDHNGTAAARRAGYAARSCRVQASQLLSDPRISACVEQGMADMLSGLKASAADTLAARARAAYFDPLALVGEDGLPLPLHALDAQTRAMLSVNWVVRASGPEMRVRLGSREAAFRALERAQAVAEGRRRARPVVVEVKAMQAQVEASTTRTPPDLVAMLPEDFRGPLRGMPAPLMAGPEAPTPVPPIAPDEKPQTPTPTPEAPPPKERDPGSEPQIIDPAGDKPRRDPGHEPPAQEPGTEAPARREPGSAPQQQVREAQQWKWWGRLNPVPLLSSPLKRESPYAGSARRSEAIARPFRNT